MLFVSSLPFMAISSPNPILQLVRFFVRGEEEELLHSAGSSAETAKSEENYAVDFFDELVTEPMIDWVRPSN